MGIGDAREIKWAKCTAPAPSTGDRGRRARECRGSAPGYEGTEALLQASTLYIRDGCVPPRRPRLALVHISACCAFQSQCAPGEAARFGLHVSRMGRPAPFLILSQQLGRRRRHARHRLRGNTSPGHCCLGM
ncbi:hypothetical protein COCMIDRAFT_25512 [Bipolaris oryzae ATCC 44560]|uniref:Uncharacterized protein n=1 Tax=Bipolaris oryzae ATCC 44560 TaxID=930090 RepID=W6ZFY0_COCMI|nr:uncharacterized protein COCMIDRAFT_25512 [Bipolaris oryzae ATCC 44560]EUC46424.1 hypothetical protein COCMIDRAFT_25512 [Bipolaris oryzae ATCC 44560]